MISKTLLPLSAGAIFLGFVSCKDSSAPSSGEVVNDITTAIQKGAKISLEERANALGYVQYLPKDTEAIFSLHNGDKLVNGLLSSPIYKLLSEEISDLPAAEELKESPDSQMLLKLLENEVTIAFGKGTAEQAVSLNGLNNLMNYQNIRSSIGLWLGLLTGGDSLDALNSYSGFDFGDKETDLVNLLQGAEMPPLTVAFRVEDEQMRKELTLQLYGLLSMAQDHLNREAEGVCELVEAKRGESTFSHLSIDGEKLLEANGDDLIAVLPKEHKDSVIASLAQKDLHLLVGESSGYLVLHLGGKENGFVIEETASESLLVQKEFQLIDTYLNKELFSITYASKDLLDKAVSTNRSNQAAIEGLSSAISDNKALGDTRDAVILFDESIKKLDALKSETQAFVSAGYYDQGLKFESYGGVFSPLLDYKKPRKLGSILSSPNAIVAFNYNTEHEANAIAKDAFEYVCEALYVTVGKLAASTEVEDEKLMQAQSVFTMFDTNFVKPLSSIWNTFRGDIAEGLGDEQGFVLDFEGAFPKGMGLPPELSELKVLPRFAFVYDVDDRSKLQSGWEKMEAEVNKSLEVAASVSGGAMMMTALPQAMSSDKDGLKTWFYPLPIATDDLIPSVSVSDTLFYVSTSKSLSESLTASMSEPVENGVAIKFDFKGLSQKASSLIDTIEKNSDLVFSFNEKGKKEFDKNKQIYRQLANSINELGTFTSQTKQEKGVLRNSAELSLKK